MDAFYTHIEKLTVRNYKKIHTVCNPLFETFGFNGLYFQIILPNGTFATLSPNVDLLHHYYLEEKLYKQNPFIVQSQHVQSGMFFDKEINHSRFQEAQTSLEKATGINCFMRFVKHENGYCKQFGFGKPSDANMNTLVLNELPLIRRFMHYFESELQDIILECRENSVDISDALQPALLKPINNFISDNAKSKFLRKCGYQQTFGYERLTQREIECLKIYIKGISANEMSVILGLSNRTVESYLANIKNKLHCGDRSSLIQCGQFLSEVGLI